MSTRSSISVAGDLNLHHLLAIIWCYYIPAYFHVLVAFNKLTDLETDVWLTIFIGCGAYVML